MTTGETGFSVDDIHDDLIAGRYRVERELGRGGMSTVFLCADIRDGDRVALKVLRPEVGSVVLVERFLREIDVVSKLNHPQIPTVLDSGVLEKLPFYVMTFIEGESLRTRLQRVRRFSVEEAVRITQEVAKPMAYAHSRGIIHRDIKPANVLLSPYGVFVLDFGVARAILASTAESLTPTGVAVGTPAYMSPEQAIADNTIDERSDIYSLACVTYEMIAGGPPFIGASPRSVMAKKFMTPPAPLSTVRGPVSQGVQQAIMKAMRTKPADRWKTVEEFAEALGAGETAP
jgi:serine/threonine-protein kinase